MSSCSAIAVSEASSGPAAPLPGRLPALASPSAPLGAGWRRQLVSSGATLAGCARGSLRGAVAIAVGVLSSVWVLLLCKAIIGLVAAFDTYLTIKYAVSLDVYEQNPLGRWLMGLDDGPVCETQQIAAFITAKFVGTLMVMIAIQGLAYWRVRVAGLVALPLAVGQLVLVSHLILGDG